MTTDYQHWAAQVRRLHQAVVALEPVAEGVGVAPPAGEEWFELLERKLLPEVMAEPMLVVAVVGGTNIGKSLLFNHLAGEVASAASRLAAGTKHPVCLVPSGFADAADLDALFEDFEVTPWRSADDPLADTEEHRLFWRVGRHVPPRLLLLDTPDIDSDAKVNWQRADRIRQAADVLVAVLTQQKYNDAAVKQFFRKAAEADKPVVVIFNQCDMEADREYWPQWLATFTHETGARPQLVYAAPYDRQQAEQLALPLLAIGANGKSPRAESTSLRDELAALHFDAIKIRTFRGALAKVTGDREGAGAYLASIEDRGRQFHTALEGLSSDAPARVDWPPLPTSLLVAEIGRWWDPRRSGWTRGIHGFYRQVGKVVTYPLRKGWQAVSGDRADATEAFRVREREAIVRAVGVFLDELERLASLGNDVLQPRLRALLSGHARAELLASVQAAYDELPALGEDFQQFVHQELDAWADGSPRAVRFLRSIDNAAAIGRPAITVGLVLTGAAWTGADQAIVHAAGGALAELAKDAAITTTVTGGGEAVVSVAGESVKQAAARLFARLQSGYARLRAAWLAGWLQREVLGDLLDDLRAGAEVTATAEYREAADALAELKTSSDVIETHSGTWKGQDQKPN